MTWGIIAALSEELRLIVEEMESPKTVEAAGFHYHVGTVKGVAVVAVQSSIGKINAALCASILVREFGVTHLVNVGVAGAMHPDLRVFDVVVSDELIYHDIDLDMYARYHPFQRSFRAHEELVKVCVEVIEALPDRSYSYKVGRIATGDVFVGDPDLRASIAAKVDPLCVEMEGAAVAQVAVTWNIPFLVIRAMSDNADEDGSVSFDTFLEQAAVHSATILLALLDHFRP